MRLELDNSMANDNDNDNDKDKDNMRKETCSQLRGLVLGAGDGEDAPDVQLWLFGWL